MTNTILDAGNLAEVTGADGEPNDTSDLTSTHEPDVAGMSFHVQMNGYTLGDFEEMVVQTAARLLLESGASEHRLKKTIEERAIALISQRCDEKLAGVTSDILNNPVMIGGKDPITMGEFIGITGRDYLSTPVDHGGKPTTGSYDRGTPRINRMLNEVVGKKFSAELSAGIKDITKELKVMVTTKLDSLIVEERARIATALGYEVKKPR